MLLTLDSGIYNINLLPLQKYVTWHPLCAWFPQSPGENHHCLLAYLSSQLQGGKVADLGSQYGASALALSYNPLVHVFSYDIQNQIPEGVPSFRDVSNITSVCGNCFAYIDNYIDASITLLDIAPHNGSDERTLLRGLLEREYKGLLVCDDIHLSQPMKDFWNDVQLKKFDVTPYGHWSGTGVIVFDPKVIDVKVI